MSARPGDGDLAIHHEREPPPPELTALASLYAQARSAGMAVAVVSHSASPPARKILAKRRHDLKAALRTLGFTVKALEGGYTFQDDKAAAKIEAIAKAVRVLEREGDVLAKVLATDHPPIG